MIVFMGSVFAVLYHLGVMQRVVNVLAAGLGRTLGTSGAESLAAVANVFLGMTESALVVRPYLERMTRSELFCLMTVGMSTRRRLGAGRLRRHARRRRLRGPPGDGEPALGAGGDPGREADGAGDGGARDALGRRTPSSSARR